MVGLKEVSIVLLIFIRMGDLGDGDRVGVNEPVVGVSREGVDIAEEGGPVGKSNT
jgi:hypothetical protein